MKLADHVILNFNNNMLTTGVYLDIEKSFDTTWHSDLLYKLSEVEFSTYLIKLMSPFSLRGNLTSCSRRTFYAKKNSGRGSSRSCLYSNILQSIHKWCPAAPYSVRRRYSCDRKTNVIFSANCNAASLHELMVWAPEHKWRLKGYLRRSVTPDDYSVLQLSGRDNPLHIRIT
jgi:hypothetical protein